MEMTKEQRRQCQHPFDIRKEYLIKDYIIDKNSTKKIAEKYQVNEETVRRLLIRYDIPRRDKTENIKFPKR